MTQSLQLGAEAKQACNQRKQRREALQLLHDISELTWASISLHYRGRKKYEQIIYLEESQFHIGKHSLRN